MSSNSIIVLFSAIHHHQSAIASIDVSNIRSNITTTTRRSTNKLLADVSCCQRLIFLVSLLTSAPYRGGANNGILVVRVVYSCQASVLHFNLSFCSSSRYRQIEDTQVVLPILSYFFNHKSGYGFESVWVTFCVLVMLRVLEMVVARCVSAVLE